MTLVASPARPPATGRGGLALRVAATFLGWLVRAWVGTFRVDWRLPPGLDWADRARWVIAFRHGEQMAIVGARHLRPRRRAILVSCSRDGALQSGVMKVLGMVVERGSSTRRAAAGLRAVVARLSAGLDAAFAVDGPRGPWGRAKPGAALAAAVGSARLVPVAGAAAPCVRLGSWDRFEVPLPFARVAVVVGAPVDAELARRDPTVLERSLDAARREAERVVRNGSPRLRWAS